MKYRSWIALGALALAACSPQTPPPPAGELIKKGQPGTVTAGTDGELQIDKDKLAKDAIVSIVKTNPGNPPSGVSGGFTALRIKVGSVATRPAINKQEVNLPELPGCETGFRMKISFPAETENASDLRMYNVTNGWTELHPYFVNLQQHYVIGCMADLNPLLEQGEVNQTYTLGIPSTFKMAGGTSEDFAKSNNEIFPVSRTAFRINYVGALPPAGTTQKNFVITGPSGWNDNKTFVNSFNPRTNRSMTFNVDTPPVTGTYQYTYNDGIKEHSGQFQINSEQVLARPSGINVTPSNQAGTLTVDWTPPAGAALNMQQVTVSLLSDNSTSTLGSAVGNHPVNVQVNNFDAQKTYAVCVFAFSNDPVTTPFPNQVNESRFCTTYPPINR
ncbi:hypothetical protein [Deinococcus cellulosilyticus]|uniref:Fibronectin type-III domain-containing protein n=1 Tax=Deinococcus cellulosilyticus (strain DSM 18568 / NBRC 106333 / KACC 11606 / 5516J-15) TaxID=1223518 RepID=A0A511N4M9_DEIC1|nr:hypothetical protein [Deinococcus cellulosilyticus]GEM47437.1 hypothetical protein DC3_30720 [Deinococcus cellulosilyticus NBRC 106333 = KACC 11606]